MKLFRRPVKAPTIIKPRPDYAMELIKYAEGCKLTAYKDIVGIWTIGYGHTGPEVKEGLVWTQEQAEANLLGHINKFRKDCEIILDRANLTPTKNQLDALTSFAYNLGKGAVKTLTNGRNLDQVKYAIFLYHKAGGKPIRGLKIRRAVEQELFSLPDSDLSFNPKDCFEKYRNIIKD